MQDSSHISLFEIRSFETTIARGQPGESLYVDKIRVIADSKFENSFHDSEKFYIYWVERIVD